MVDEIGAQALGLEKEKWWRSEIDTPESSIKLS
jgi:hypothetical protein